MVSATSTRPMVPFAHFLFSRQGFNPSTKLEDQLYNALDLRSLYTHVIENHSALDPLKWKHTYFFFRGLRHIQYLNGRGSLSLLYQNDPDLKTLEAHAIKVINEVIQRHGFIKSY